MDQALYMGFFHIIEIHKINYCWMYLNAIFLSDIVTADGTTIEPKIYTGHTQQCPPMADPVTQQRPDDLSWSTWQKFLNNENARCFNVLDLG